MIDVNKKPLKTPTTPPKRWLKNLPAPLEVNNFSKGFNNKNIKIVSRTANQVQFKLPFGVSEAIVSIKKKGLVVHLQCKVVNE